MAEQNYNAFEGLDLSNARNENETREEYKLRKKRNNKIMKLYFKVGREQFQQMFPEGVKYDMFEVPEKPKTEYNKEEAKKFVEKMKKAAEKLGEAK